MPSPDRRAGPRAEVELEVHYRTAQEFTAAYVRNISGGGIFRTFGSVRPVRRKLFDNERH
jgi:hypothetical protein